MEEWTEEEFIESIRRYILMRGFSTEGRIGYINKLIGDKQFREETLAEKDAIVKREIDILEQMREWGDEEFKSRTPV